MSYERPWYRHYDYCVPASIRIPRIAVHDLLQIPANACPDKAAFIFGEHKTTFWELRRLVFRFAGVLAQKGVRQGSRVGIHLPTSPHYIIAYFATLSLGAIVVNINPLYTVDEMKEIVLTTGLKTLITVDTALSNVTKLCTDIPGMRVIITDINDVSWGKEGRKGSYDSEKDWYDFMQLLQESNKEIRPRVMVSSEDPAVIQFTGGTTGVPKGAILTHGNIVAATLQFALWITPITQYVPIEKRSTFLSLPLFHVFGNLVLVMSIFGAHTQILVPRFQVDETMDIISRFNEITYFPAVPTMITAILNHRRAGELQLGKKIGILASGGAPLPVSLIEKIDDMGLYFLEGAGMTETAAMGHTTPIIGPRKPGSVGIPAPGMDARLVDLEEGAEDVPDGEPGEILFRGPNVTKGFWNNSEETEKQIRDGWLHTGDVAVRDEDGYVYIVDRKKDMIIAGGYNIYPREIDEILHRHPKVKDAVAVGIPDEYRGETVKAFIVPKDGEMISEEEIVAFCKEKLVAYKVPKIVEFRESLPESAVGKILRKALREEEIAKKRSEG